jgi:hypothetical protein
MIDETIGVMGLLSSLGATALTHKFLQASILVLAASMGAVTTAAAQESAPADSAEFMRECGVGSADLYLRDVTINSRDSMAYCSVDYNELPLGVESTFGVAVGVEEQVNNLNLTFTKSAQAGPIQFSFTGGGFYFWEIESLVWLGSAEATIELFDGVSIGGERGQYWGDYEDVRWSGFGTIDVGDASLELGYSTLDTGPKGPYAEFGYTWYFAHVQPSLSVLYMRPDDDEALSVVLKARF